MEKEAVDLLYHFFGNLSICRERFTWSVEKVAARCALHCRSDAECSQCRSFVSFFADVSICRERFTWSAALVRLLVLPMA